MTTKKSKPGLGRKISLTEPKPRTGNVDGERAKYNRAIAQLEEMFPERGELARGIIIALLTRSNIFALGPPGTAKSMMIKTVPLLFHGSAVRSWSYLLTKFTEPNEILGPYNYSKYLEGQYERNTAGYFPDSDVAFLDEIFKANSAILNSLLAALDGQRIVQIGRETIHLPTQLFVGASNELPEGKELGALYDRFALKYVVGYIEQKETFTALLTRVIKAGHPQPEKLIDFGLLPSVREEINRMPFNLATIDAIAEMREQIKAENIPVSDRTWLNTPGLLRAQAWLAGDHEVYPEHGHILRHVLWQTPEQKGKVATLVDKLADPIGSEIEKMVADVNSAYGTLTQNRNISDQKAAIDLLNEISSSQKKVRELSPKAVSKKDKAKMKKADEFFESLKRDLGRRALNLGSTGEASTKPSWRLLEEFNKISDGSYTGEEEAGDDIED